MFEIYFNCINEHSFAEKRKSYRELESAIIFKLCRISVALTLGGIKSPPSQYVIFRISWRGDIAELFITFRGQQFLWFT